VWAFSKDGSMVGAAPQNLFRETDFYTIPLPGGGRGLVLERFAGARGFTEKADLPHLFVLLERIEKVGRIFRSQARLRKCRCSNEKVSLERVERDGSSVARVGSRVPNTYFQEEFGAASAVVAGELFQ
jgi:hypothetical protein